LGSNLAPPALRAAIIVRSSGYERGFAAREGDAVLVVVKAKSGAGADDGKAMAAVFSRLLEETEIANRRTHVVQVTHESSEATAATLKSQRAEIVYFSTGLENIVKSIPAQEGKIVRILVCAHGGQLSAGCTLGVELADDKPRIVLNLTQANAAKLRFEPAFLRLARIVR
jgi:phosphomannomutase